MLVVLHMRIFVRLWSIIGQLKSQNMDKDKREGKGRRCCCCSAVMEWMLHKMDDHPVHTTPNHYPLKIDYLPKTSQHVLQTAAITFAFPFVWFFFCEYFGYAFAAKKNYSALYKSFGWTSQKDSELTNLAVRTMNTEGQIVTAWQLTDRSSFADNAWNPAQVEVYDKLVVFETILPANWFGGYLAVDSITHEDGGEGGCETLPREAAATTVPPETTTTPGWIIIIQFYYYLNDINY